MPRHGKRRKIATNIYLDANGISGCVTVRGRTDELRFPLGTTVEEIRRQMGTRRRELEKERPETVRGTLADVVRRYLNLLPNDLRKERQRLLQPWVDVLGDEDFGTLSRSQLQQVTEGWRHAGLSASRVNKRISALRVAWHLLAPDDVLPHGIERVTRYREPIPEARAWPMYLIELAIAAMPASASRARVETLTWTGQPPAIVMKIEPKHVRWASRPPELYISPRRKGAGVADAWIPLLPRAQRALRHFFRANATGTFQTSALARSFKRGVRAAQRALRTQGRDDEAALLDGIRLYDLRHSFATWFASHTKDQWALQQYLRHARMSTTDRYMRGAADVRLTQAIATLSSPQTVSEDKGRRPARKAKPRRRPARRSTRRRSAKRQDR